MNFTESAIKSTTLAAIMENREKLETDEIIRAYPAGFIIDEIEFVTIQKKDSVDEFWAYHIKNTDKFAFAGFVLAKIFNKYLEEYEGDMTQLVSDFKASGGIKVRLASSRTKSGNNVTTVEVLK